MAGSGTRAPRRASTTPSRVEATIISVIPTSSYGRTTFLATTRAPAPVTAATKGPQPAEVACEATIGEGITPRYVS